MTPSRVVYVASLLFHLVIGMVLSFIKPPPPEDITVVELETIERPKKEEEKKEEPKPDPVPEPRRPAPKPQAQAEEAAPPPPDFGFVLGPGSDGPGGIAVPTAPKEAPVQKTARTLSAPTQSAESGEPDVKAKPLAGTVSKPAYTPEAQAAGIEGKVRIEVTIDATGQVTKAVVIKGLGHGLDEAAIAAAKAVKFTPAQRGGKPVASTFVVSFTFTL